RRPVVVVREAHRARGVVDPVGVVDVPPVRRPGADALRVVVGRVVGRHPGAHRGAAARHGQVDVVEGHVGRLVGRVGAPDGRAVRALAGTGDVVVRDVVDGADPGAVAAPAPGTDLLHDRRGHVRHGDVLVVHVRDVGAVHRHHTQTRLARAGDGDVVEDVV